MATLDGYAPYPLELTALQARNAIQRSHVLSNILANYQHSFVQADVPDETEASGDFIRAVRSGDVWCDSTTNKIYSATIEDDVIIWFEV